MHKRKGSAFTDRNVSIFSSLDSLAESLVIEGRK